MLRNPSIRARKKAHFSEIFSGRYFANPEKATIFAKQKGGLAQLARALAWHARGHEFESRILHQEGQTKARKPANLNLQVFCFRSHPGQRPDNRGRSGGRTSRPDRHRPILPASSATGDTLFSSAPIDYRSKATSRGPAVSGRILRSWARIRSRDSCGERSGRQASGPKSVSGLVSSDQPQPYSRPWRSRG